jgi:hypothetical protein
VAHVGLAIEGLPDLVACARERVLEPAPKPLAS